MKIFHLTIARVGENLYDGEARQITLPGKEGVFTVLAHHEPYVTELGEGSARFEDAEGGKHEFNVSAHGLAEVSNNQATVLL